VVRRLLLSVAALVAGVPGVALAQVPNPVPCLPDSVCPAWVARHAGAAGLYDRGFDVAYAPGVVVVAGVTSTTSGGPDAVTIAYDASTGAERWAARYDGPEHLADGANAVAVRDGLVVVVGRTAAVSGREGMLTVAYRLSDGGQVWAQRHLTPEDGEATAVVLTAERAYVTGYSATRLAPNGIVDYDYTTLAYSLSDGTEAWGARYQGPGEFWDTAYDITVVDSAEGERVVVTGRSNGAGADFATVAYDEGGAQQWVARYDGAGGADYGYGIAAAPDGRSVYVVGDSPGNGTESDYATVAYDAVTGAQRWLARYGGGYLDLALDVAVSPSGDAVAVTGFSMRPDSQGVPVLRDAATVLYDSGNGSQRWAARHAEPDGAATSAVAFSPDGTRLFAAGLQNGNVVAAGTGAVGGQVGHAPALTLAYAVSSGEELWAAHYRGSAGDEGASAVAVSPDGSRVVVTGGGQSQGADVATVSYAVGDSGPEPVVPEVPWLALLPVAAAGLIAAAWRRVTPRATVAPQHP
jgi:hypothetical protein